MLTIPSWTHALALGVLSTLSFASVAESQTAEKPFSIVLLPDTQYYTEAGNIGTYGNVYQQQTAWITTQVLSGAGARFSNIRFVASLGDMTDDNTLDQWRVVENAHLYFDYYKIPYSVASGNHDITDRSNDSFNGRYRRESLMDTNTYFTPAHFDARKAWNGYQGALDGSMQNNYFFFESDPANPTTSRKFMLVNVEYAPRKDAIDWANRLIESHRDRLVILVTHGHLEKNGTRDTNAPTGEHLEGRSGADVWNEIGSRHKNLVAILCGHVTGTKTMVNVVKDAADRPTHTVLEILSDFQSEPAGGPGADHPAFGNGWLRVLTFKPAENRIQLDTVNVMGNNPLLFPSSDPNQNGKPVLYLNRYEPMVHVVDFTLPVPSSIDHTSAPIPPASSFRDRMAHKTLVGDHFEPVVAANPSGDFVVVWEDDSNANGAGEIRARTFNARGVAQSSVIAVNTNSAGLQGRPDVAMANNGSFVVVWDDDLNTAATQGAALNWDIKVRGFSLNGTQLFAERTVNTFTNFLQVGPSVAADSNGNFVVVWTDDQNMNLDGQIHGRLFSANGTPRVNASGSNASFVINAVATNNQRNPDVAMDASGRFVVAWEDSSLQRDQFNVFFRGFTATGAQRFSQRAAHATRTGSHSSPSIAVDTDGDCVVAWEDDSDGNGFGQIHASLYTPLVAIRSEDFEVNSDYRGHQGAPSVDMDKDGSFLVAWQDHSVDANAFDIRARSFNVAGIQLKADFIVNTDVNYEQELPAVGLDAQGRAFVAWQDDMDGDSLHPATDTEAGYNVLVKQVPYR